MTKTKRELMVDALLAARRIADFAEDAGALSEMPRGRPISEHMGAVVADSVLQAGLNYASVVRPRVMAIIRNYPDQTRVSALVGVVHRGDTAGFLNWGHAVKIQRFNDLVLLLQSSSIETTDDLRSCLAQVEFRNAMETVHGIGPKTVDYMSCLVGIDSIAVDRHVRTFAKRLGVDNDDYQFLHQVFCCAADLLSLSRRDFDAWVWHRESSSGTAQLALGF